MLKKAVLSHAFVLGTLSVMTIVSSSISEAQVSEKAKGAQVDSKQAAQAKKASANQARGGGKGAGNGGGTLAVLDSLPSVSGATDLEKLIAAYEQGSDFDGTLAQGRWLGTFVASYRNPVVMNANFVDMAPLGETGSLALVSDRVYFRKTDLNGNSYPGEGFAYTLDGTPESDIAVKALDSSIDSLTHSYSASTSQGVATRGIFVRGLTDNAIAPSYAIWSVKFKIYRNSVIGLLTSADGTCRVDATSLQVLAVADNTGAGEEIASFTAGHPVDGQIETGVCGAFLFYAKVNAGQ